MDGNLKRQKNRKYDNGLQNLLILEIININNFFKQKTPLHTGRYHLKVGIFEGFLT